MYRQVVSSLTEDESLKVREILLEKWGFDGLEWEPFEDKSPQETVFVCYEYLTDKDIEHVLRKLKAKAMPQLYMISNREPDHQIVTDTFDLYLYDTICCDDSFEWVVYSSVQSSLTFGGKWLVELVREIFEDRQDQISSWPPY